MLVNISHILRNGIKNKSIRNESKHFILYPRANHAVLSNFLETQWNLKKKYRNFLIKKFEKDYRWIKLNIHFPNFIMSGKRIMLI